MSKELSFIVLLATILVATRSTVHGASSAGPKDEPLLELFESFLPQDFLEKPVAAKNAAKNRPNVPADPKYDEAMKAAESMLNGFKNIVDGLNAPDIGNCIFKCHNGAEPQPNPSFKPVPNGCGSHGLQIDVTEFPGIGNCCDAHDICYGTCNNGQADCDKKFNSCMADACVSMRKSGAIKNDARLKECLAMGATFHLTVMALGCEFYRDAQKSACLCGQPITPQQEKIAQYNSAKRAREAAASSASSASSTQQPLSPPEDPLDEVDLSSPAFDLPEAVDYHDEF